MSIPASILATALLVTTIPALAQAPNTLTQKEKSEGWKLLWDGKTTTGWQSERGGGGPFPTTGWIIKDGTLSVTDTGGAEGGDAGDIMTVRKYANYELSVDFRTTVGANSGILYLIDLTLPGNRNGLGAPVGYEYQILDDDVHPDARKGTNGDRTVATLYGMIRA